MNRREQPCPSMNFVVLSGFMQGRTQHHYEQKADFRTVGARII